MPSDAEALLKRITQTPGVCGGRPCIRSMRIRVADAMEILADFTDLERDDIRACLISSAKRAEHIAVAE